MKTTLILLPNNKNNSQIKSFFNRKLKINKFKKYIFRLI